MVQYANNITDGLFGNIILFAIFVVAFVVLMSKNFRTSVALATSTFITTLLAMMFRILGVIGDSSMLICIVATVASVAFLIFEKP